VCEARSTVPYGGGAVLCARRAVEKVCGKEVCARRVLHAAGGMCARGVVVPGARVARGSAAGGRQL